MLEIIERKTANKQALDFVPVIFANGEDDDLPGFLAACRNERVQYEDRVYNPSEDINIIGKMIVFRCAKIVWIGDGGEVFQVPPLGVDYPGETVFIENPGNRGVNLINCHCNFVQP